MSTAWWPWRSVLPVECLFLHGSESHHRSITRADTHSASEGNVLHRSPWSRRCTSPKWCFSQEIPSGRATLAPRNDTATFLVSDRPRMSIRTHPKPQFLTFQPPPTNSPPHPTHDELSVTTGTTTPYVFALAKECHKPDRRPMIRRTRLRQFLEGPRAPAPGPMRPRIGWVSSIGDAPDASASIPRRAASARPGADAAPNWMGVQYWGRVLGTQS
jgi:hypothetical protein